MAAYAHWPRWVDHPAFGRGTVIAVRRSGRRAIIERALSADERRDLLALDCAHRSCAAYGRAWQVRFDDGELAYVTANSLRRRWKLVQL